jgi:hypothetical protein
MKVIPISNWSNLLQMQYWLKDCFGPASTTTWYVDIQPCIEEIVMNDEIYTWFTLRWL